MTGDIAVQASTDPVAGQGESSLAERLRPLIPRLHAYFVRRVDPSADAADGVSETLLALWRHREKWPAAEGELRAYAYGVARGVLANLRRSRRRQSALAERVRDAVVIESARPGPGAAEALDVRAALDRLGDKDREIVLLVAWDGLGVAEAGAVLGLSPTAARARYSRARARLRAALA